MPDIVQVSLSWGGASSLLGEEPKKEDEVLQEKPKRNVKWQQAAKLMGVLVLALFICWCMSRGAEEAGAGATGAGGGTTSAGDVH